MDGTDGATDPLTTGVTGPLWIMDGTDGAADPLTTGVTSPPWIMDGTDGTADPVKTGAAVDRGRQISCTATDSSKPNNQPVFILAENE